VNRRRRPVVDQIRKENDLHAALTREFLQRIFERLAVDVEVVDSGDVRGFLGGAGRPREAEREQPNR
jgi:hypothetical protein